MIVQLVVEPMEHYTALYSGKLLKTYGDHCPVMSKQGVTAAAMPQVQCVQKVVNTKDDIEVKEFGSKFDISRKTNILLNNIYCRI